MSLFTLRDGGHLEFRVTGAGAPVLLLRPLGGTMALWGAFETKLAEACRVIAFNPRGVGESSMCPAHMSTRTMADDAAALLAQLAPRADVFGISLGGMVGQWLAIDHPACVDRLILASALPRATALSASSARTVWLAAKDFLTTHDSTEVALVRGILPDDFASAHPERWAQIAATVAAHPTRPRDLALLLAAAATHGAESRLDDIAAETLLLLGERDPIVSGRGERELLLDIDRATMEIVPGAGHDLTLEQPLETAQRVIEFLRS